MQRPNVIFKREKTIEYNIQSLDTSRVCDDETSQLHGSGKDSATRDYSRRTNYFVMADFRKIRKNPSCEDEIEIDYNAYSVIEKI